MTDLPKTVELVVGDTVKAYGATFILVGVRHEHDKEAEIVFRTPLQLMEVPEMRSAMIKHALLDLDLFPDVR